MKKIIDKIKIILLCLIVFFPATILAASIAMPIMIIEGDIYGYIIAPIIAGLLTTIPLFIIMFKNKTMKIIMKIICCALAVVFFSLLSYIVIFVSI